MVSAAVEVLQTGVPNLDHIRGFMADDQAAAHFLYSLGAKLALLNATMLVVVEGDPDEATRYPELTVCDVIVSLRRERQDSRHRRLLEVLKARGSAPLAGVHPFNINNTGLVIYPRLESVVAATDPAWSPGGAAFGIVDLDVLVGGGLNVGTATLLAGSPGVGKTTLSLHFTAEGVRANEPVLSWASWKAQRNCAIKRTNSAWTWARPRRVARSDSSCCGDTTWRLTESPPCWRRISSAAASSGW
jgi:KaiC/GvpD/RAD55 family RecA-like ATPase